MTVYILWSEIHGIRSMVDIIATHSIAIRELKKAEKRLPSIEQVFPDARFILEEREVLT